MKRIVAEISDVEKAALETFIPHGIMGPTIVSLLQQLIQLREAHGTGAILIALKSDRLRLVIEPEKRPGKGRFDEN